MTKNKVNKSMISIQSLSSNIIRKSTMRLHFLAVFFVLSAVLLVTGAHVSFAQTATPTAPEPIIDLAPIPGNEEVRLDWSAPFDNGAPITSYKVIMWQTGSDVTTTYPNLSTSTSTTITGLKNGVSYSFKVFAINSAGTSADSNIVLTTPSKSIIPPEPITDLVSIPGNEEVRLVWSAPFDNGVPITNYKVIMWQTGSDVTTTYPNLSTSTSAILTGLKNGVSYSFKVFAINSAGTSADSNIVSSKPVADAPLVGVPSKINTLVATRDDGKANLSWTKPNSNGSSITSFVITYWQVGTNDFFKKTVTADATKAQVTGLTNGVSYAFKINAKNGVGFGPDSNIDSATPSKSTTASVPNQVRKVIATPSDGQVFLSWIEPSDNGASISSYTITVSKRGSNVYTTYPNLPATTQATISDLTNGQTYEFTVSAVNSKGTGKASAPTFAIPNNKNPISISNLKVTPANEKVKLSWSISTSDLEKISGYRIRVYESGSSSFETHSLLGKTTNFTLDGLKNGKPYGFQVFTVSSEGLGPGSRIVSATPFVPILVSPDAPGQIKDLKAVPGDSKVTLSWTAPSDKGSSITQYRITQVKANSDSFKTIEYSGTTKSAVITGLQNEVTYNFKIQGKNAVGLGPESNTVSVIPKSSLPQPTIPAWIKTTAQWWAEGKISNLEYSKAIEWLINEGIIRIK